MWHVVYRTATGELVSVGTVVAETLADGLSSVAIGVQRPSGQWNPATLAFESVAQVKPPITKLTFLRRIPQGKRLQIREAAKTDQILADAMNLLDLAEDVSTEDTDTVQLVGYLQTNGYLTADEAAAVLA